MANIDELIVPVTESQIWASLTAAYDAAKVAWRSWGTRNAFLVLSQFAKSSAYQSNEAVRQVVKSMFLQLAIGTGKAFEYFARSQYGLERQPAVFTVGRVLIAMSSGVGPVAISASQLHAGTPGPVNDLSRLYTSTSTMTLQPGEVNVVEFTADVAGDSYNLPVGSPFELKSSVAGASVSIGASGEPTQVGIGNASLIMYSNDAGVTVEVLHPGAVNQSIAVTGNLGTKRITVSLPTNGAAALFATAATVRKAIADAIPIGALAVGPLLLSVALGGDGTGIVQPTAAPLALPWLGTWVGIYGRNVQDDESLALDCYNRWDTLGGGSGDGVPVSDAQTDGALAFWAKRPPVGYQASPVARCKIYSNINQFGASDGSAVLVLIAGSAGALPAGDVTAVAGNFENPRKYSYGITLRTASVINALVQPVGVVRVKLSSGRTLQQAAQAVADAFAKYSRETDMVGYKVEPSVITGIVIGADIAAIDRFELTGPIAPVQLAFNEYAVWDLSAIVYAFV